MKKIVMIIFSAAAIFMLSSCLHKHEAGRPESIKRPNWSNEQAAQSIEKMAQLYRQDEDAFRKTRTYVWSDTWVWPETIGINSNHLPLLKKMFYEGDNSVREIVMNVILMNIPSKDLKALDKKFLQDIVLLDTDLKERRADVPPPHQKEEIIIEEFFSTAESEITK